MLRFTNCVKFNFEKSYLPSDSHTNPVMSDLFAYVSRWRQKLWLGGPLLPFAENSVPFSASDSSYGYIQWRASFITSHNVFSHVKFILLNWLRNRSLDSLVIYIDTFFKLIRLAAWAIAYVKWPKEPQKEKNCCSIPDLGSHNCSKFQRNLK